MASDKRRRKTFLHWVDLRLHGSYGHLISIFVALSLVVFIATWLIRVHYGDSDGYRALLSLINPFDDAKEATPLSLRVWNSVFACIGSIVFMGILVSTIVNWVEKRRSCWQYGEARYRIRKPYTLIIGSHPLIIGLVKQLLCDYPDRYIIILTEREAYRLRNELSEAVGNTRKDCIDGESRTNTKSHRNRIVIYTGSIVSADELRLTKPDNAADIYILGEGAPTDKDTHDNKCLKVFNTLCRLYQRDNQRPPVPAHVLLERNASFKVFLHTDMAETLKSPFQFIPYSYHDLWGQRIFGAMTSRRPDDTMTYRPLDGGTGISYDDRRYIHLVIIGFDEMARSLCLQAAQLCHFPNFCNNGLGNPRSLITVISAGSQDIYSGFINLYSSYFSHTNYRLTDADGLHDRSWDKDMTGDTFLTDTSWEFIAADINSPRIREYLTLSAKKNESVMTVAICYPSAGKATETALSLPPDVYANANQILVRQDTSDSVLSSFSNESVSPDAGASVATFGMPDRRLFSDITSSRPAYFIGLSYDAAKELADTVTDSDISSGSVKQFQKEYIRQVNNILDKNKDSINCNLALSPQSGKSFLLQRYSNIYHAYSLYYRQRSFGMKNEAEVYYDASRPNLLAETEHNRWITEQLIAGFRAPGSADQNTSSGQAFLSHPDLRPFNRLPDSSKTIAFAMSSVAPIVIMSNELSHEEFTNRIKNINDNVSTK